MVDKPSDGGLCWIGSNAWGWISEFVDGQHGTAHDVTLADELAWSHDEATDTHGTMVQMFDGAVTYALRALLARRGLKL